jgi:hypothetical protein
MILSEINVRRMFHVSKSSDGGERIRLYGAEKINFCKYRAGFS